MSDRLSGYACRFGVIDRGGDIVARGAFAKTLRLKGLSSVPMLLQHDPRKIIGRWSAIREDECGLYVEGSLSREAPAEWEARAMLKRGLLNGLSIGYRTVRGEVTGASATRSLLEIDLWEISLVTFPMQPSAVIRWGHVCDDERQVIA
ncbi:HK97 family phage prohead protease [Martelella sp. AMO21009]